MSTLITIPITIELIASVGKVLNTKFNNNYELVYKNGSPHVTGQYKNEVPFGSWKEYSKTRELTKLYFYL